MNVDTVGHSVKRREGEVQSNGSIGDRSDGCAVK